MMWMMVSCLLIFGFIVFAGGGAFQSWPSFILIGAMVGVHLWMMRRGHTSSQKNHADDHEPKADSVAVTESVKDEKGDHSCCH
ncbi:MAG: hypothetical protein AAB631_03040 [Patescibacteria group bacterium]